MDSPRFSALGSSFLRRAWPFLLGETRPARSATWGGVEVLAFGSRVDLERELRECEHKSLGGGWLPTPFAISVQSLDSTSPQLPSAGRRGRAQDHPDRPRDPRRSRSRRSLGR